MVSYLTEELVRAGHRVTLFASGDSLTAAELVAVSPRSLRLDPECVDPVAHHVLQLERVLRQAARFDVIHWHTDYLHYPLSRHHRLPGVTTLHGRLDIRDLEPLYRQFAEIPLVSVSNAQRKPLPWVNWLATVYHGIPEGLHTAREQPGKYLAFLGRVSPEKGLDRAIEIAQRAGMPLKICAKVDAADREYFETVIRPLVDGSDVEYLGEIGYPGKDDFLGGAFALLLPIDWPEPFGLVMVEAMACGTPVVAFRRGSVPEVVDHGVTGFIVDNVEQAVCSLERVPSLSRRRCRQRFEQRFSASRMMNDYLAIYGQIVERASFAA